MGLALLGFQGWQPKLAQFLAHACLYQQAYISAGRGNFHGVLEVPQRLLRAASNSRGAAQSIVHASNQHLADQLLAATPVLGKAGELARGGHVAQLLVGAGSQKRQLGAVRVML